MAKGARQLCISTHTLQALPFTTTARAEPLPCLCPDVSPRVSGVVAEEDPWIVENEVQMSGNQMSCQVSTA